ncbi:MAG: hypothetical protein WC989_00210 [Micavibrio sp.]
MQNTTVKARWMRFSTPVIAGAGIIGVAATLLEPAQETEIEPPSPPSRHQINMLATYMDELIAEENQYTISAVQHMRKNSPDGKGRIVEDSNGLYFIYHQGPEAVLEGAPSPETLQDRASFYLKNVATDFASKSDDDLKYEYLYYHDRMNSYRRTSNIESRPLAATYNAMSDRVCEMPRTKETEQTDCYFARDLAAGTQMARDIGLIKQALQQGQAPEQAGPGPGGMTP